MATKKKAKKISVGDKAMTKTEIVRTIAEHNEMTKKEVVAVLDTLNEIMVKHIAKRGPGVFTYPGMFKITVVKKPAVKARKGINPFTGEETMFKAKPASRNLKIRALKQLKDSAN